LADIWNEAVAYQVMTEIQNDRSYAARRLIANYGGGK
jgi:hypothetical protein